ncbi:VapC toxin family PIN domain ribonuclease [Rhodopseudomonas palustris]|uniref:Ribonuclease VapC n=1 Tax=Rhodopseudomonas palustris TaxID=1076 RepID=A0A323UNV6_RHOPL|nr:type II toxin-antitoxin system VapC family toxin [Rhodopseudomonas palustris]PZA13987.1 VapC toxin family PIN domain ribonuclease [Rhodopseudomonas palustris]
MTTLVVDASVAVKWLVLEEMSDAAKDLSLATKTLVAPRLIMTEVANVLARKTIHGLMEREEAASQFRSLPHYFVELIEIDELIEPALLDACTLRHPVYDLIYLETARRLDAQVVTADRRFAAKLAGTEYARYVTLLSDWQPE